MKGHKKVGGKKKGVPNHFTQSVKDAFKMAFDEIGGAKALAAWGKKAKNRDSFYKLASKLIPQDLTSGDKPIAMVNVYVPEKEPVEPSGDTSQQ